MTKSEKKFIKALEIFKNNIQTYELQRNGLSKFKVIEGKNILKDVESSKSISKDLFNRIVNY